MKQQGTLQNSNNFCGTIHWMQHLCNVCFWHTQHTHLM